MGRGVLAIIALVGSTLVFSGCKDDERADVSDSLLQAFAAGCSSHGLWTDAAIAHSQKLVGVLKELKNNDACAQIDSSLIQVQKLNSDLDRMFRSTSYRDYRMAEESVQEIALELARPEVQSNLDISSALTYALMTSKSTLASSRAALDVDQFSTFTAETAQTLQTLALQSKDLVLCFKQSPAAALKVATNALALGGSFITPVLGAGVHAIGQLINGAVDYFRYREVNDAIWKAHENVLPQALTCGLETMTQLYCQANDAYSILELQRDQLRSGRPGELWRGMDILGRRLPVISRWISKVKAGVTSDPIEKERQISVWNAIHQIENAELRVDGALNELQVSFLEAKGSADSQSKLVIHFIEKMAQSISGQCTSPFGSCNNWGDALMRVSSDSVKVSCVLALGSDLAKTACPKREVSDTTLEGYIEGKLMPLVKIDNLVLGKGLQKNWSEITRSASALIEIDFRRYITVDPAMLLDLAFQSTPDNYSPREVFQEIYEFLTEAAKEPFIENPHHLRTVNETLSIVTKVIGILDSVDGSKTVLERVLELFVALELHKSKGVFMERLVNIAEVDVRRRLNRGEFPQDISAILRSAGYDIHDRLMASGVDFLGAAADDINSSRSLVQGNIENFRAVFGPLFSKAIAQLHERALRGPTPEPSTGTNRPNGQTLAKLCLLYISSGNGEFPDKQTEQICSKARLTSIYAKSASSAFAKELDLGIGELWGSIKSKPFMDRVCSYYRFTRTERLVEILRRRNSL